MSVECETVPKKFAASENRRSALNMKTTADLRERLEQAAAKSGRSLTHEVEHRIERSFFEDGLSEYKALKDGDDDTKQLSDSIKLAMGMLNQYTGRNWLSDLASQTAYVALISQVVAYAIQRRGLSVAEGDAGEPVDAALIGYISKMCFGIVSQDPDVLKLHEMAKAVHESGNTDK